MIENTTVTTALIVVGIFVVLLIAVAIYSIAKKRVAKATARAMEAHDTMQKAINQSDRLIVALNLEDDHFYNIHGDMLPPDGETGLPISAITALLHPDYLEEFAAFIEKLRKGETQDATLDYLFNTDYTGGEPKWHQVHTHAVTELNLEGKPSHIILTMTDETEEARFRHMEDEMSEKYEQLLEDSIIGISYYNADGYLIDCNRMMREICEFESRYDPLYFDTCIYDFAQFNINREHVEESWLCIKLEMTKRKLNKYLEVRVHPINDTKGKLKYIAMGVRDISGERDLYLQSKQNSLQIQNANEEIRRYEDQLRYLLENSKMHVWRSSFEDGTVEFLSDLHHPVAKMSVEEFAGKLQTAERKMLITIISQSIEEKENYMSRTFTRPFLNLLTQDDKVHWYNISNIPSYDKDGRQTGYFGLIRDITQLIDEQEQLKHETERANDSDRMKSVFLANMTHEIRTPLNAIVGFSDLLTAIDSPEEKSEMLRIIRNNCDMLLRLINDFLAISSIESNGLSITPKDIDFAKEFNDICQSLSQRVTEPVQFITENPYTTLLTTLDRGRIAQVITNFVTNAVKFTQQGHIKVGYEIRDNGLYIYCEDTGAGIPEDKQEKIFERFVKLNEYIQGTGLGLNICKSIAQRCGGQIGVHSEGLGQGSTFWIWVPCEIREKA